MNFPRSWFWLVILSVFIGCSTSEVKDTQVYVDTSDKKNENLQEVSVKNQPQNPIKLKVQPTVTPIPDNKNPGDVPPERDLESLAKRYRSNETLNQQATVPSRIEDARKVGEEVFFTVTDPLSAQTYEIEAELIKITENVYWYLDTSLDISPSSFDAASERWETDIRPIIISTFGDINKPGIDGDDRLVVLNTPLNGAAGYFGSQDTQYKWVHPSSNQREMVYMDPLKISPLTSKYLAVLTHEYQHAIHDNLDRGEESWVNEGLSEVASYIAGFESSFTKYFLDSPSISLVHWPDDPSETVPHYGASSLFFMFSAGRNGGIDSLGELAELEEDGINGVDSWLSKQGTSFDNEFSDWIVANYVGSVEGVYSYSDWALAITAKESLIPWGGSRHQIPQYGARYFKIPRQGDAPGEKTLVSLRGDQISPRFLTECSSKCWWSNRGDSINTKLTLNLDLRDVINPYLSFEAWYDIEKDWDYTYVSVSEDNGETWKTTRASGTTDSNPSGNNYGYGYTGYGNWDTRLVGLDNYSGKEIKLRFEYVTDDAVHRDGFMLGAVELPALELRLEPDDTRWDSEGFVLIDAPRKQNFIGRLITFKTDGDFAVSEINFDEFNRARFEIEGFGTSVDEAVMVISGTSRDTIHPTSIKIDTVPVDP